MTPHRSAAEREWHNFKSFQDVRSENGSTRSQNLALNFYLCKIRLTADWRRTGYWPQGFGRRKRRGSVACSARHYATQIPRDYPLLSHSTNPFVLRCVMRKDEGGRVPRSGTARLSRPSRTARTTRPPPPSTCNHTTNVSYLCGKRDLRWIISFNGLTSCVVLGRECIHHTAVAAASFACTASERRGNNLKGFKDFYLKAKARIWP